MTDEPIKLAVVNEVMSTLRSLSPVCVLSELAMTPRHVSLSLPVACRRFEAIIRN